MNFSLSLSAEGILVPELISFTTDGQANNVIERQSAHAEHSTRTAGGFWKLQVGIKCGKICRFFFLDFSSLELLN